MEVELNPTGGMPFAGAKSKPMERGGCPGTPVRLTMLPGPARASTATGMTCWRAPNWSPTPVVTVTMRGPVTPTMPPKVAVTD